MAFRFVVDGVAAEVVAQRIADQLAPEGTPPGTGEVRYHGRRVAPLSFALERQEWVQARYGRQLNRLRLFVDIAASARGSTVSVRTPEAVATFVVFGSIVAVLAGIALAASRGEHLGAVLGIVGAIALLFGGMLFTVKHTAVAVERAFLVRCANADRVGDFKAIGARSSMRWVLVGALCVFLLVAFVGSVVSFASRRAAMKNAPPAPSSAHAATRPPAR